MLPNFLYHYTGLQGSGPWYAFWSGIFADITIVTAAIQIVRHKNCHVKGCWRFGKQVDGTPYLACHIHHPNHKGNKRNVSLLEIHQAAKGAGAK